MKRLTQIILVASVTTILISCSGKPKNEVIAPQGMNTLDLSRFGKPFSIFVPDTTAAKLEVLEQSNGSLDIKVGKNFAISINEQPADIELRKTDIKGDEVNKLKSFIIEEPSAIIWESEITEPEVHFIVNKKIGNSEYSFEDVRDPEAKSFGREAIQKMFDSSKNCNEIPLAN